MNTQLACQNQIKVFTVFRIAQLFAQNLHKLKPGRNLPLSNVAQSISLFSWNAILFLSIETELGWLFIDVLHIEIAVQTWREAQKVTQFYEFFVEIMAQNTNIQLIYNSLRPWRRLQECEVKKAIWERQKAKPVNNEFIF